MSIADKIIETGGYFVWYGAWILGGVTLGFFLHPLLADASTLYDNITIPPTGAYTTNNIDTDQTYFDTINHFDCIVGYTANSIYISSITIPVAPSASGIYGNEVGMWIWNLGTATSTLVGTQLTTGSFSQNLVTLSTSSSVYATITWTFGD